MYMDDLRPDMEWTLPEVTIDRERMMDFARLYDPIPLHMDAEYARSTRFGDLIAPGVMTFMSMWAEFVKLRIFGDELIAGKSTKIEWFRPVYAGETLQAKVRFSALERRNAFNGLAETYMEVFNAKGELVLTNITESIVKYRA